MSTSQKEKYLHSNEQRSTVEYDGVDWGQKITINGYGNTIIIHGDMLTGSELFVHGADSRITIEGSMHFRSKIIVSNAKATVIIQEDMWPKSSIDIRYGESTIQVMGTTSKMADIWSGYDSIVDTVPNLEELTAEEYGVYMADLYAQDVMGIHHVPHMGMPFRDWIVRNNPRHMER